MKHKTFFWFILPTFLAMFFFITLPIISVVIQSLHTPHENILITVENCDPFVVTTREKKYEERHVTPSRRQTLECHFEDI